MSCKSCFMWCTQEKGLWRLALSWRYNLKLVLYFYRRSRSKGITSRISSCFQMLLFLIQPNLRLNDSIIYKVSQRTAYSNLAKTKSTHFVQFIFEPLLFKRNTYTSWSSIKFTFCSFIRTMLKYLCERISVDHMKSLLETSCKIWM